MKKTFIIWLTAGRKVIMESTSFINVMERLLTDFSDTEIKRIYCIDDDRSLVLYNNISGGRNNG